MQVINCKLFSILVLQRIHSRRRDNPEMFQQFAWKGTFEDCRRGDTFTSTFRQFHSNRHFGWRSAKTSNRLARSNGRNLQSIRKWRTFTESLRERIAINLALAQKCLSIQLEQSFFKPFLFSFTFVTNQNCPTIC